MQCKQLYEAMQKAGLDQTTADFLVRQPVLLELLIITAKLARLKQFEKRLEVSKTVLPIPDKIRRSKLYAGKVQVRRIPEVVKSLMDQHIDPSITSLAKELETSTSNLLQIKKKYPAVARLIKEALQNSSQLQLQV